MTEKEWPENGNQEPVRAQYPEENLFVGGAELLTLGSSGMSWMSNNMRNGNCPWYSPMWILY